MFLSVMLIVMAALTDWFEIILIKCQLRIFPQVFDVVHRPRPYHHALLPAPAALVMILFQHLCLFPPPDRRSVELMQVILTDKPADPFKHFFCHCCLLCETRMPAPYRRPVPPEKGGVFRCCTLCRQLSFLLHFSLKSLIILLTTTYLCGIM